MLRFALPAVLIVCGLGVYAQGALFRPKVLDDPKDVEQVKQGWIVYVRACAKCHGDDLHGEFGSATAEIAEAAGEIDGPETSEARAVAPAHDASGTTWRHSDQTLFEIIKFGAAADVEAKLSRRMPAFKDKLTDDEIHATIALIKSTWPPQIQAMRDETGAARR